MFLLVPPTWVVPDKRLLNGCVCVCVCVIYVLTYKESKMKTSEVESNKQKQYVTKFRQEIEMVWTCEKNECYQVAN